MSQYMVEISNIRDTTVITLIKQLRAILIPSFIYFHCLLIMNSVLSKSYIMSIDSTCVYSCCWDSPQHQAVYRHGESAGTRSKQLPISYTHNINTIDTIYYNYSQC